MKLLETLVMLAALSAGLGRPAVGSELTKDFKEGDPQIRSMGTLEFGPEGILFVGDSRGGAVFAIDTDDLTPADRTERFSLTDVEGKIGALLGTTGDNVLIHDMAVNPISKSTYLTISRGRSKWESGWYLPNDVADASIILRITTNDAIEEVKLENVRYKRTELPNPVDPQKTHRWKKGLSQRVDAITEIVYESGKLYVSGLSNEEFAAALWTIDFPSGDLDWSTLEIFHGSHGKWETYAPVRTFLPYEFNGEEYVLASYLCTPLVTFRVSSLHGGDHVKGHTVAEFGSGNFPLDMVLAKHEGKVFFVLANSQLPLLTFAPESVTEYMGKPGITQESPTYTEGVPYTARAGSGIMQLDNFNEQFLVALQRQPNGKLDLVSLSLERLAL